LRVPLVLDKGRAEIPARANTGPMELLFGVGQGLLAPVKLGTEPRAFSKSALMLSATWTVGTRFPASLGLGVVELWLFRSKWLQLVC
jgi:hypothetical protein